MHDHPLKLTCQVIPVDFAILWGLLVLAELSLPFSLHLMGNSKVASPYACVLACLVVDVPGTAVTPLL